ncbi:hypothetical protein CDAR_583381 [Caerostris darwini]|uniref:Uncharacterized protein n=1 Tax=Caerostris darwini TaxID=1538125 RepID=A0AAV4V9G8_9ARAC|nr:hypothetical protein CDAR_583381 [Caerostris darwini]
MQESSFACLVLSLVLCPFLFLSQVEQMDFFPTPRFLITSLVSCLSFPGFVFYQECVWRSLRNAPGVSSPKRRRQHSKSPSNRIWRKKFRISYETLDSESIVLTGYN